MKKNVDKYMAAGTNGHIGFIRLRIGSFFDIYLVFFNRLWITITKNSFCFLSVTSIKELFDSFSRESFFITSFLNNGGGKSRVAFAAPYPGKIIPLDLAAVGGKYICQKDAFLCAAQGVEIEVAFTKKLGAGIFGGEGFILQRLEGDGMAFLHAGGTVIEKELAAGETLRVDTGCLVAFAPTVEYDIKFVGGFTNALFGGEGLFLATLKGPGKVFLQSLPFSRLADRIVAASKVAVRTTGESTGVAGIGGNILGRVISGN